MKIVQVDIHHLRLRLKVPFETSYGLITEKETVLLRARSHDGLLGYGEAPVFQAPWYDYESVETVIPMLRKHILPAVLGREIPSHRWLESAYRWITGHHSAKAAIESAYWHLRAQIEGVPLAVLWKGTRESVPIGISLGMETDRDRLVDQITSALEHGYRRVKIKIKPGFDVQVVEGIRERLGPIPLMVDANGAYWPRDLGHVRRLDDYQLLMLEQPFGEENLVLHASLQKTISTPICLDESIRSASDVDTAAGLGAARIVTIKPSRLGGYGEAARAADRAVASGMGVWCGGMLETGIGKAFNVHLSSLEAFSMPGDTAGTDRYFEQDVLRTPIVVDSDGTIQVPQTAGLGYEVDDAAIEHLTVSKLTARGR